MNTLETDIEIGADGSVRLLSPLPAWLKPGRAHVLMTVESVEEKPRRGKLIPQYEEGTGDYTANRHQ